QDDKGWDARKRAYCLKIQPATGSFARNLIYSTKPQQSLTEEENRVVEGLQGILRGECYFSQKLASYLITHSGNYRYNSSESALLTHREKEILNKLRIGASNIEIARSLFISENTVKTHLYNLFKKIAVKNRTQAVSWANDNLRR
ncbi:LuxR C-terminal-related transcriptional regulator, partial [Enterobacter hormaechei]|uniref:LuxR C-terminal-related transcriptional regulator n=2 Tax=Enterobacter hormaechei TaxID=158836 RepID=UPI001E61B22A